MFDQAEITLLPLLTWYSHSVPVGASGFDAKAAAVVVAEAVVSNEYALEVQYEFTIASRS